MSKVGLPRGTWMPGLLSSGATALLSVIAVFMMFSAFMFYDDEGYVLISLRNFAEHGHLYREVYSQYGPFPYALYYVLHLLGFPFTHTAGRLLTIGVWSVTAAASAALVWNETRNLALRLAVLASAYVFLWPMVSEPTHPGALIAVISVSMALLGQRWIKEDRLRAWGITVGIGTAALILTKINMGGLAAMSAAAWFLLHHQNATIRRWSPPLLIVAAALLPYALMRFLLAHTWAQTYAVVFACGGVTAMGASALASSAQIRNRVLWPVAIGAAATGLVVAGIILARGSTPYDLLEGVLLRPLRHPVHFNFNFNWPRGTRSCAMISVGLCALAWWLRRRGHPQVDVAIAVGRLLAALVLAYTIAGFPAFSPDHLTLSFAGPWLWLFLWPLAGEDPKAMAARTWVGLLYLGQTLHAFPVRGSQTSWGSILALPVAALGAWQAVVWLLGRFPVAPRQVRVGGLTVRVAVAAFALFVGYRFAQVGGRFREGRFLNLPGAAALRLPESSAATFQILTLNAAAHGDMLFSMPGMYSLNFWSGLPTPTLMNVTHWFSLLDEAPQREIIRSLEAHPRACLIVQREHMDFIAKQNFNPGGPLYDYVTHNFSPAFTVGDFEFCVRNGRKIAPLQVAENLSRAAASSPEARDENTLVKWNLLLPDDRPVSSVELIYYKDRRLQSRILSNADVRITVTPITPAGNQTGPEESRSLPLSFKGLATVSLYFDAQGGRFPPVAALVVLHDAAGNDLALVRFEQ